MVTYQLKTLANTLVADAQNVSPAMSGLHTGNSARLTNCSNVNVPAIPQSLVFTEIDVSKMPPVIKQTLNCIIIGNPTPIKGGMYNIDIQIK